MRSSDANTRRRTGWKLLGGPGAWREVLKFQVVSNRVGSTKRARTS